MDIDRINLSIRDLVKGYIDKEEEGVRAFGGKLDVRPPYQREFIYKDKQRNAVIDTIMHGYPLNVMYWSEREDGTYEIIDGQQRTISICQYVNGDFSFNYLGFENLEEDEKNKILDYELDIYICRGKSKEKLKWFETINIAGEKLTNQELRNAVYAGSFISDAKKIFSKRNASAYLLAKDLVTGTPERQEILETALKWICEKEGIKDIRYYLASHQHDSNANLLWNYFQTVINWVLNTFNVPKRKSILKGLDWGKWYELKKDEIIDKKELDNKISILLKDSEVTNKKGIVPYIFTNDERYLDLRTFGDDIKEAVYEEQKGICPDCKKHFTYEEMEGDHDLAWSKGGRTIKENCVMRCVSCNRKKSNK